MREKLEQKEMRNESETTDPLKPGSGVVCLESLSLSHTHTHTHTHTISDHTLRQTFVIKCVTMKS